jgi:hypothetical protein
VDISRRFNSRDQSGYMARVRRPGYPNLTATSNKRADAVERMRTNDSRILGGRSTVKRAAGLPAVK